MKVSDTAHPPAEPRTASSVSGGGLAKEVVTKVTVEEERGRDLGCTLKAERTGHGRQAHC